MHVFHQRNEFWCQTPKFLEKSHSIFFVLLTEIVEIYFHQSSTQMDINAFRNFAQTSQKKIEELLATSAVIMSGETSTLVVCPQEDPELADQVAIAIGILTVVGTIVGYFVQQYNDRQDAAEAKIKEDEELDRAQALERVRKQLSVLVGPLHRLWKIQTIMSMRYRRQSGHGTLDYQESVRKRGEAYWMTQMRDDFLQPFIDDPHSFDAVMYRNYVTRRAKPIYTRIRELVLNHMSDLADMPPQEEWLERYSKEDITSPHTGSVNINVIFDSYTAYTFEFDDIIESWAEGDFRRMQPTTRVPFLICNTLVDLLFDNAKEKEARYNKHVSIHKNTLQGGTIEDQISKNTARSIVDIAKEKAENAIEAIEEKLEEAKDAIEEKMGKEKPKEVDEVKMGEKSVEP